MYFYHVEILHFMTIQLGIIKLFKVNSYHKTVKTMHFHFYIRIFWSHSFSYRMETKINENPHRKPQLLYNQENKMKTSRSVSSV